MSGSNIDIRHILIIQKKKTFNEKVNTIKCVQKMDFENVFYLFKKKTFLNNSVLKIFNKRFLLSS